MDMTTHLTFLISADVLVGFNEEALNSGILVVGWRGSTPNETHVWFFSSLVFGWLHLPNALLGMPVIGAVPQVIYAYMAGNGFYICAARAARLCYRWSFTARGISRRFRTVHLGLQ